MDIMVNHMEKGKMSTWHYTISGRVNGFHDDSVIRINSGMKIVTEGC